MLLAGGDFFGLGFDAFEHAAEDKVVEGKDAVPVEDSEQAFGLKLGDLFQVAASMLVCGLNAKFQNGDTG